MVCHNLSLFQVMVSVIIHGYLAQREVFLFGCQGTTDTSIRILGAIYTVPKPIKHNPGMSVPVIISGHGFEDYP